MNIQNIKFIALDLDGTLLNEKKEVPESTQIYLNKLREKGYLIVAITGRILANTLAIQNPYSFLDYVICCGGSNLYDVKEEKMVYETSLDFSDCQKLVHIYKDIAEKISFCDNMYYYNYGYVKRMTVFDKKIEDFDTFFKDHSLFHKVELFFENDFQHEECLRTLQEQFSYLSFISMQDSFGIYKWVEVYPPNINKPEMLSYLTRQHNCTLEYVVAFGDGRNDIELLKRVGWGIAMGNALDVVKEASNDVTLSYMEKGVEHWLREHLPL